MEGEEDRMEKDEVSERAGTGEEEGKPGGAPGADSGPGGETEVGRDRRYDPETSSPPRAGPGPRETQLESAAPTPQGLLSPSLCFHNCPTEMVLPTPQGCPEA